jgi:DNA-binding LytR/AlgR family response regulator
VLILEDEYQTATLMTEWVVAAGYHVVGPVATPDSAQALITEKGIDAALLDVRLGDERSFELARRLQAMRVPFAFVTGYSQALVPAAFKEVPTLTKPVHAEAVAEILQRLLPPR